MHERLLATYEIFTLVMRSGAFLSLIVTLVALVSKLDRLVLDALAVLPPLHRDCHSLLLALHPQQSGKGKGMAMPRAVLQPQPPEVQAHSNTTLVDEDLGHAIERRSAASFATDAEASATLQSILAAPPSIVLREQDIISEPATSASIERSSISAAIVKKRKISTVTSTKPSAEKKPKKKPKQRRDEIDDIFS
ncbi:hypothetical protein FA95DRAFT_1418065 [Auriscalpium vulgare]|uniref:Uncharacterized protein n=1 Tax=Auriscalpium vulgare TaxID=40419 RepID=A0ACB8RPL6_9AGAM|nr:hypothetical protein FA95DRAFT_1418065 [Auriscalpium vulgare]